jgi:hypothetical protein
MGDSLATWSERNRPALREFWAREPADAVGVKQEREVVNFISTPAGRRAHINYDRVFVARLAGDIDVR